MLSTKPIPHLRDTEEQVTHTIDAHAATITVDRENNVVHFEYVDSDTGTPTVVTVNRELLR